MSFERRKVRVGRVVSDKMDKTVVVAVEWRRPHPLYKKPVRRRTRFKAHDAENQCRDGDLVRIIETRPLSRTKRWRIVEILARQDVVEIRPEEIAIDEAVEEAAAAASRPRRRRRAAAAEATVEEAVREASAVAETETTLEPKEGATALAKAEEDATAESKPRRRRRAAAAEVAAEEPEVEVTPTAEAETTEEPEEGAAGRSRGRGGRNSPEQTSA